MAWTMHRHIEKWVSKNNNNNKSTWKWSFYIASVHQFDVKRLYFNKTSSRRRQWWWHSNDKTDIKTATRMAYHGKCKENVLWTFLLHHNKKWSLQKFHNNRHESVSFIHCKMYIVGAHIRGTISKNKLCANVEMFCVHWQPHFQSLSRMLSTIIQTLYELTPRHLSVHTDCIQSFNIQWSMWRFEVNFVFPRFFFVGIILLGNTVKCDENSNNDDHFVRVPMYWALKIGWMMSKRKRILKSTTVATSKNHSKLQTTPFYKNLFNNRKNRSRNK